ncbi:hypothetical protein BTVI_05504 [Pitangus sulphuratus]|nr:hypothetical protein BTVI_05504 [Pitangus sulphuratus]
MKEAVTLGRPKMEQGPAGDLQPVEKEAHAGAGFSWIGLVAPVGEPRRYSSFVKDCTPCRSDPRDSSVMSLLNSIPGAENSFSRVDLVSKVEIGGCLGHSDHGVIEFKISVGRMKGANKSSTLDMRRADFRLLRELGTRAGNSQMLEVKQVKQKAGLTEQGSSLGKGKKEDPGNYRPVSLTSVHSKVMEKIILGSIEKHLKDYTVIGQSQNGFLRGKSCLSNLMSFYDKDLKRFSGTLKELIKSCAYKLKLECEDEGMGISYCCPE